MPIVFLLFLASSGFGRAFNIYATINHAAAKAPHWRQPNSCALCGNVSYAANPDPIATTVAQALMASKLDPAQVSSVTPTFCGCGTTTCATRFVRRELVGRTAQDLHPVRCAVNPVATTPGSCGVAVSFRYSVPVLFAIHFPRLYLRAQKILLLVQGSEWQIKLVRITEADRHPHEPGVVATGFNCTSNWMQILGCPADKFAAHETVVAQVVVPQPQNVGVTELTCAGSSFEAISACATVVAMGSGLAA